MSEQKQVVDLSEVPFELLWKELKLRHGGVVLITMVDDLGEDNPTETKECFWSGGSALALGLVVWARRFIENRHQSLEDEHD